MSKLKLIKVTLSSGKVVLLRELKISHTEQAAQKAAIKSNGDSNLLQMMMQKPLLQGLIHKIDDKEPTPNELEDLDSLFNIREYGELLKVLGKLMGADDPEKKEPKVEFTAATPEA